MADNEKQRAVELALKQVDKAFGKGALIRLGDKQKEKIESISTGSLGLDGLRFDNIALDIETLNEGVLHSRYLISAMSFSVYPFICDNYALLNTAMSFGMGYGPKLVKRKGKILKSNFKVALSGKWTTNAMLFKIKYPNAKIIYKNFLDIHDSVLNGEVDAGVLIHESVLNFNPDLEVELDIWDVWTDLVKDDLPLPLGGMVISRSIPLLRAILLQDMLSRAVNVAVNNKSVLSSMIDSLVRVNKEELNIYLDMYANEDSITLSDVQIKSLNALFKIGYNHGIYSQILDIEKYLIPSEYIDKRFQ